MPFPRGLFLKGLNLYLQFAINPDTNEQYAGDISCVVKASCIGNEVGVVSLYQTTDSHVGPYSGTGTYANKICCSVTQCPSGFDWNEDNQVCQPQFATCLLLRDSGTDPTYDCKELWSEPISQTGLYWNDALTPLVQDCFADFETAGDNGQACCYRAEYLGNTYGAYTTNTIIKEPISEILEET